jgi:hypothetical protein
MGYSTMKKLLLFIGCLLTFLIVGADSTPPYSVKQPNIDGNFQDIYNTVDKNYLNTVKYQDPTREINVKDYGAKGDGVTNDAVSIQSVYDTLGKAGGGTLIIPAGNYYIGNTTLIFNYPYIKIKGQGNPNTHLNNVVGTSPTTITYNGNSIAVMFGVPGTHWILGNSMENIGLNLAETSLSGIDLYGTNGSYFKNISIFGNSGAGHYGMRAYGIISTIFELIDISGSGTQVLPANYDQIGFYIASSTNEISSATDFRRCYFHYCVTGVWINGSIVNFSNCDFEACTTGMNQDQNSDIQASDSKWEDNATDVYFGGATAGGVGIFSARNCFFNHYNYQTFFDGASSTPETITFSDCEFSSDHASPYLFSNLLINGYAVHSISIINPIYAGAGASNMGIVNGTLRSVSILKSTNSDFKITSSQGLAFNTGFIDPINTIANSTGTIAFDSSWVMYVSTGSGFKRQWVKIGSQ